MCVDFGILRIRVQNRTLIRYHYSWWMPIVVIGDVWYKDEKYHFCMFASLLKFCWLPLKLEKLNMTLFGYKIWLKIAPRKQFETHFSTFKLSWKSAMHTQSVKYKLDIKRLSIRLKILYHFSSITHSNVFNVFHRYILIYLLQSM